MVVIIVVPPGVPATRKSSLFFSTMIGVIELSILFWGIILLASPPMAPNILGVPGLALKSSISLLRKKPAPPTTTAEPYQPLSVVVHDTAFPSASTTER